MVLNTDRCYTSVLMMGVTGAPGKTQAGEHANQHREALPQQETEARTFML